MGNLNDPVTVEVVAPIKGMFSTLELSLAVGMIPFVDAHIVWFALAIAHQNSQRLAYLVNDLLDMEKLIAEQMYFNLQVQPLMPLLESSLESNHAFGKQYQVTFVVTERADDVQVRADSVRLQQVFANLFSNAVKFSPTGGQVEIAVRRRNAIVRVEVGDHGTGIPVKFHRRIFQKFSQADTVDTRKKGGTGLGLAISKELIERMGGQVGFV